MTNRLLYGYTRLQSTEKSDSVNNLSPTSRVGTSNRFQGHDSDSSDNADSDISATQLRRIQKKSPRGERWPGSASHTGSSHPLDAQMWDYIEHLIKPGETLQGLALQYRVSVFELKRANSIGKEVEFHARRILKIPVHQHSSLKETVPNIQQSDLTPPVTKPVQGVEEQTSSANFLDQVDQDLQRIKERARVYDIDDSLHTDMNLVRNSIRPKRSDCSGDDWGLSWTQLVCIALLLLLACPLLYFLHLELAEHKWLAEKRSLHHQPQLHSNLSNNQNPLVVNQTSPHVLPYSAL